MPSLRRREEILEALAKRRYWPWLHVALTIGSGIAICAFAAYAIDDLNPIDLLVVPPMFLAANLGEWTAHKWLLHRRVPGLTPLYDQHTPIHHAVYRYESFTMKGWRELKLILIPPFGVAMITVAASPAAYLVAITISENAGWLIVVTSALYVVGYEVMHMVYHLREDHPIARLPVVHRLREHHRRHHDPRVMQKWNFNVVIPIGDWLFGTWLDDRRFEEIREKSADRSSEHH